MKKLTKQKQMYLALVAVGTVLVLAGIWYFLICNQRAALVDLANKRAVVEKKLTHVIGAIKNPKQSEDALDEVSREIAAKEEEMASGDLYSWIVSRLRRFKQNYSVDIPQYSQPAVADTSLLPKFPYKQATVTVAGTAYYDELGKFAAEFENMFPHSRLLNLELEPAASQAGTEVEKISFKMDIVTLVVPNPT